MNSNELRIPAMITWLTNEEGGVQEQIPFDGVQPSMRIGKHLVACVIFHHHDGQPIAKGQRYLVDIELRYLPEGESLPQYGEDVTLQLVGRVLARGSVQA